LPRFALSTVELATTQASSTRKGRASPDRGDN
jgi:hypothetical protein